MVRTRMDGQAIAAGPADECRLFVGPIAVGGGKRALPDGVRVRLDLLAERRFRSGVVDLRYSVRATQACRSVAVRASR